MALIFFGLRAIFVPGISGAEGQSRTDMGSPLPVFEFDVMPSHKWQNRAYNLVRNGHKHRKWSDFQPLLSHRLGQH